MSQWPPPNPPPATTSWGSFSDLCGEYLEGKTYKDVGPSLKSWSRGVSVTLCTQLLAAHQSDRLHCLTRLWSQQPLGRANRLWLGLHSLVSPGSAGGLPATSAAALTGPRRVIVRMGVSTGRLLLHMSCSWSQVHWKESRFVLVSVVSDQWLSGVEPPMQLWSRRPVMVCAFSMCRCLLSFGYLQDNTAALV